jgi:hypothetical protein
MTTISVGESFELKSAVSDYAIGSGSFYTLKKGTRVEVKRINQSSVWLRGLADNQWGTPIEATLPTRLISGETLDELGARLFDLPLDPNAPKPRALGEKPEGDEFIGQDHPGIQWLFEDMGKYATQTGRPKNFKVTKTINGFEIVRTYKARSKAEAEKLFAADLLEVAEADIAEAVTA